jgi:dienelactone hydrolase
VSKLIQTWFKCGLVIGLTACGSNNSDNKSGGQGAAGGSFNNGGAVGSGGSSGFQSSGGAVSSGGFGAFPTNGGAGGGIDVPPPSGGSSGSGTGGTPSTGGDGSGDSSGTDGGGGTPPATDGGGGGNPSNCFPSVTDYTADGPFIPTSGDVASVQCTIFAPTTLGANGCKNPVIVWGNGTFNTPSSYTALFNHWASHGFIVAAADTSNSGSGKEMLACLQYMIDQSTASGSPYAGKVDTKHIASSGYSQGGAGCLEAGEDPRFVAVAAVSPFITISLGGYDTTSPGKQIHPLFMISGSADTVAVPAQNQQPIFMEAMVPIVWATHAGSSHLEVLNNGGAYAGPLTAWFRYKLMEDPAAAKVFEKPDCTLCSQSGWMVQFNSLWK